MPFQTRINSDLPIAVAGDFASANARMSTFAMEAALVAGVNGVTVGQFAWIQPDGRSAANIANGATLPAGFVAREMQGLYTRYLDDSGMQIFPGFGVTLYNEGEFFATVTGSVAPTRGMQVYASYANGAISFGSAPTGATATGSIGATFTATGSGTNLTVTGVTGLISLGDIVAGTNIPAGTTILSQTSGTTGGAGVYVTSAATTIAGTTATSYGNVLNVTAVASGLLTPGVAITGTNVPANATVASQTSGATGGTGVYTLNVPAPAYVASTALTTVGGILTNFYARSACAVGELVAISTWGKM